MRIRKLFTLRTYFKKTFKFLASIAISIALLRINIEIFAEAISTVASLLGLDLLALAISIYALLLSLKLSIKKSIDVFVVLTLLLLLVNLATEQSFYEWIYKVYGISKTLFAWIILLDMYLILILYRGLKNLRDKVLNSEQYYIVWVTIAQVVALNFVLDYSMSITEVKNYYRYVFEIILLSLNVFLVDHIKKSLAHAIILCTTLIVMVLINILIYGLFSIVSLFTIFLTILSLLFMYSSIIEISFIMKYIDRSRLLKQRKFVLLTVFSVFIIAIFIITIIFDKCFSPYCIYLSFNKILKSVDIGSFIITIIVVGLLILLFLTRVSLLKKSWGFILLEFKFSFIIMLYISLLANKEYRFRGYIFNNALYFSIKNYVIYIPVSLLIIYPLIILSITRLSTFTNYIDKLGNESMENERLIKFLLFLSRSYADIKLVIYEVTTGLTITFLFISIARIIHYFICLGITASLKTFFSTLLLIMIILVIEMTSPKYFSSKVNRNEGHAYFKYKKQYVFKYVYNSLVKGTFITLTLILPMVTWIAGIAINDLITLISLNREIYTGLDVHVIEDRIDIYIQDYTKLKTFIVDDLYDKNNRFELIRTIDITPCTYYSICNESSCYEEKIVLYEAIIKTVQVIIDVKGINFSSTLLLDVPMKNPGLYVIHLYLDFDNGHTHANLISYIYHTNEQIVYLTMPNKSLLNNITIKYINSFGLMYTKIIQLNNK